ncbi:hypothetical protein Tco_1128407 [Tanacetum coccineum]
MCDEIDVSDVIVYSNTITSECEKHANIIIPQPSLKIAKDILPSETEGINEVPGSRRADFYFNKLAPSVTKSNDNQENSPTLQDQILSRMSSLETFIRQHNERAGTPITPIRLTFTEEGEGNKGKDNNKGPDGEKDEDLKRPYKEVLKSPFTRRIIEFSAPNHRKPANLKIYGGSTDPDDHITRFVGAGNQ